MQHRKATKSPPRPISPSPPNNPKQFQKLKLIFISMAALLSSALLTLLLFFTISSATRRHNPPKPYNSENPPNYIIIHEVCKAARDSSTCEPSLSQSNHVPSGATVLQAIQSALFVSSQNLNTGRRMVQDILDASASNPNRSNAAKNCLELLRYSEYRMNLTVDALPRGAFKDARAWMSAALVYQYDCWSALKYVNDTSMVDKTMAFFHSSLIAGITSDALGMMVNYDVFGEKTASWGRPKTERDGFWESAGSDSSGSLGGVPPGMKVDATVCKDGEGGCDFKTVQQAVDAAPDNAVAGNRFVIRIKAGVYEETVRVPLEKKNVVLLGDGMGKTVITGSMNVGQQGMSTYNSATVDTLYAHSLRQYYKSCHIQGNVDFIFGNSAAFFQDCLILVAPRQLKPEKGENNAVTAHGRIDPAQSTGFVFQNCVINGTDAYMGLYYSKPRVHKNFLGRPWKEYSRTVFIGCTLEALITPDGWMPWSGDFALKTLYYGEMGNVGPGSDTSKRVRWSSQIPGEHASSYSVQNFIQGDQWIPTSS
ncbi:hypothetical protein DH2020_021820 [Rehmannia glutinosa]|uniref:Pectinesterase inhibitor domain-containing protein n=1 Tax=Rehmannia glutinosa TaxID=99300 RepID=A0ABR0WFS8_REHGL